MKALFCAALHRSLLAACRLRRLSAATAARRRPAGVDVARFHLGRAGRPRPQIAVEPFDAADANGPEFRAYRRLRSSASWPGSAGPVAPNRPAIRAGRAGRSSSQGSREALDGAGSARHRPSALGGDRRPATSASVIAPCSTSRIQRALGRHRVLGRPRALTAHGNTDRPDRAAAVERLADALFQGLPRASRARLSRSDDPIRYRAPSTAATFVWSPSTATGSTSKSPRTTSPISTNGSISGVAGAAGRALELKILNCAGSAYPRRLDRLPRLRVRRPRGPGSGSTRPMTTAR